MRFLVVILVALATLSGCPLSRSDEASGANGDDEDPGGGMAPPEASCARDSDCELAAASCCECPTFAANVNAPTNRACEGIMCPMEPTCAGNVRAACDGVTNECVIACVEMACPASCPDGYRIDPATGCLSCECATPAFDGCTVDGDCVQTRADCCGCELGGSDTAVLGRDLARYEQSLNQGLGCPSSPACPNVNQCDADEVPRCIQGTCELTSATAPGNACTGPCAGGQTCILNRDPVATQLGVGVCAPQ